MSNEPHIVSAAPAGRANDLSEMQERIRALEAENARLRSSRGTGRVRGVGAVVLLAVAVLLAPIAVIGTWARLQLVDTDRFVATFAPLASDPDVQDFIAAQVSAAINERVDLSAAVGELFDGLRALDLPPRADTALTLLEAPAARGVSSLIDSAVHEVIASDQFAAIWAESLRFTHERATAIMQNDPDAALQLSADGVVSVELGVVIARVKDVLAERGVGIADLIPVIERSIPIAQADALALVQTVCTLAVAAGFWLPWIVLGLFLTGVLLAPRTARAVFWAGTAFAVVFVLFAAGIGVGRGFFVRAVSPSIMNAATAQTAYDHLTSLLIPAVVAAIMIGVVVAVWAWIAGPTHGARALRDASNRAFSATRKAGEARGLSTGRFGVALDRLRGPIVGAATILALVVLIASRPITAGSVIGASAVLVIAVLLVELLRRPEEVRAEVSGTNDMTAAPDVREPVDGTATVAVVESPGRDSV